MKKRSSGFNQSQNSFVARVKRASVNLNFLIFNSKWFQFKEGYDPLFQCDSGCCDYDKCIRSKPLRSETFKVPDDSDFVSGTASKDYDLPDLKEDKSSGASIGSTDGESGKREELIGSKDALSLKGSDKEFRS